MRKLWEEIEVEGKAIGFEAKQLGCVKVGPQMFETFLQARPRSGPEARKTATTSHLSGHHQQQSVQRQPIQNFVLCAGLPTTAFKAHFLGYIFTLISTSPCHLYICLGVLNPADSTSMSHEYIRSYSFASCLPKCPPKGNTNYFLQFVEIILSVSSIPNSSIFH